MDRLQKTAFYIVSQNQQTIQCDILADIGQTLENSSGHNDTEPRGDIVWGPKRHSTDYKRQQWTQCHNQKIVLCELLTDTGQSIEDSSGHNGTKPADGSLWGTARNWTDIWGISLHSDTEPWSGSLRGTDLLFTDCTLWCHDRHWTGCRRQQWT